MLARVAGDLVGRRLGHYRIDGALGEGGMSVLYRATDLRLGRTVALKVISERLTGDPEFRERFVAEARNTSAIAHPNIVPVYDFGEFDGLLYIAMRLVDGADLAALLARGPFRPGRALALLAQVADALDALHAVGLVHLDVKPANVLVTAKESAGEHVYLADFGLTRHGATGHRTRGGDFLGSPTYADPEHLRGEPVDGRTDQYALACVLFACLAGTSPFRGEVPDVVTGHLHREPPPVNSVLATTAALPAGVDDVLRRGMAKRREQRYGTCRELVAAAGAVLGPQDRPGEPGQAPPPQQPVRLRPPAPVSTPSFASSPRRGAPPWAWPVGIAVLVTVGIVVALAVTLGGGTGGAVPEAPPPTGTGREVPVGPTSTAAATPSTTEGLPSVLPTVPPSGG
jgi:serine/threonine-protein kinase